MLVDALAKYLLVLNEGVFMLDSEFMPLLSELGLTETIKTRDVLLPLGRKQKCDFLVLFTLLKL